jgi:hypothetical protein
LALPDFWAMAKFPADSDISRDLLRILGIMGINHRLKLTWAAEYCKKFGKSAHLRQVLSAPFATLAQTQAKGCGR